MFVYNNDNLESTLDMMSQSISSELLNHPSFRRILNGALEIFPVRVEISSDKKGIILYNKVSSPNEDSREAIVHEITLSKDDHLVHVKSNGSAKAAEKNQFGSPMSSLHSHYSYALYDEFGIEIAYIQYSKDNKVETKYDDESSLTTLLLNLQPESWNVWGYNSPRDVGVSYNTFARDTNHPGIAICRSGKMSGTYPSVCETNSCSLRALSTQYPELISFHGVEEIGRYNDNKKLELSGFYSGRDVDDVIRECCLSYEANLPYSVTKTDSPVTYAALEERVRLANEKYRIKENSGKSM